MKAVKFYDKTQVNKRIGRKLGLQHYSGLYKNYFFPFHRMLANLVLSGRVMIDTIRPVGKIKDARDVQRRADRSKRIV
jgi:hypothetical protein